MSYDNGTLPDGWHAYPRETPEIGPCGCDDYTPSDDGTYCEACGSDVVPEQPDPNAHMFG